MKLKNILTSFAILLAATSCSMEDDVLNDMSKEATSESELYATLDLSLGSGMATRAATDAETPNDTENSVTNCYIAVFNEAGTLLASRLYSGEEITTTEGSATHTLTGKIIFKVPAAGSPALKIVAIAQMNNDDDAHKESSSIAIVKAAKTYSDLMAVKLLENPTVLVKVGEKILTSSDYTVSSAITNVTDVKVITIPVKQRSAAIQLTNFDVVGSNGATLNPTVTKIELLKANRRAKVQGECIGEDQYNGAGAHSGTTDLSGDAYKAIRLYTYENTNNDALTSLRITYLVGGISYNRTYTIKTGNAEKVDAATLYKLNVTISMVNGAFGMETADWIKNTIELGDITGSITE